MNFCFQVVSMYQCVMFLEQHPTTAEDNMPWASSQTPYTSGHSVARIDCSFPVDPSHKQGSSFEKSATSLLLSLSICLP